MTHESSVNSGLSVVIPVTERASELDDVLPKYAEFLGQQGADLVGYPFHEGTEIFEYEGVIKCNWKCMVDSFCETYHVPILHGRSVSNTLASPENAFRGADFRPNPR